MIGCAAGRIWFSPPTGLTRAKSLGVYCLGEGRRQWICTDRNETGRCFIKSGSLVWIATHDGLLRYDLAAGCKKRFTTRDGLAANRLVSVAADDRYLWIGAHSGVSRLERSVFEAP